MPEHAGELSLRTIHRASFALPCVVPRARAYLGDPAIVLSAMPSVERIVLRQRGSFRVTLAPVQIPGVSLRPAIEVLFAAELDRVRIESVPGEPHALEADEVATHVAGGFLFSDDGQHCTVRATLKIEAAIPARLVPPFMPYLIAHRTAETVLTHRMTREVAAMTRALVHGYPAWEVDQPR